MQNVKCEDELVKSDYRGTDSTTMRMAKGGLSEVQGNFVFFSYLFSRLYVRVGQKMVRKGKQK